MGQAHPETNTVQSVYGKEEGRGGEGRGRKGRGREGKGGARGVTHSKARISFRTWFSNWTNWALQTKPKKVSNTSIAQCSKV